MTSKAEKKLREASTKAINSRHINVRNEYLNEAKSLDFLNAVFCIHFYNTDVKRWGDPQKMPDISPYNVFNHFDKREHTNALEKCIALIQSGLKHGDLLLTAVHHKNAEECLQIRDSFRLNNPGFIEKNLERALNSGMRCMR